MRIPVFVWAVLIVGMSACYSGKKMLDVNSGFVSTQPVNIVAKETIEDTVIIEQNIEPLRSEKAEKIEGADLMHYCIIVGSFMHEQNALHLRRLLLNEGFLGTSIMRNPEGMYRVSIGCDDSYNDAWDEVTYVRNHYPQFRQAWVLEIKD